MRDEGPAEPATGPGPDRFGVAVRPVPETDTVVLALVGELDRDTVRPLWQAVEECPQSGRILVDCSGLGFCDSSGLNALLRARLRALEAGGCVELAGLRAPVDRMFEITGARGVFRVYGSMAEALSERGHGSDGAHGTER
ncbi:STAS domain-containing protein [Streptomyces sp. LMG1-1-1.1]|uniref:STAS domain-containing protein n=1 Tax=Streptomyces sp. LMG1-1-1.1 TaxID=3135245 RepID=UPI003466F553